MNDPSDGTYAIHNATISGHRVIRNPSPVTCNVSASQLSVAATFRRTEATPDVTGFPPSNAPTPCANPTNGTTAATPAIAINAKRPLQNARMLPLRIKPIPSSKKFQHAHPFPIPDRATLYDNPHRH
jgi:hypothetical protein